MRCRYRYTVIEAVMHRSSPPYPCKEKRPLESSQLRRLKSYRFNRSQGVQTIPLNILNPLPGPLDAQIEPYKEPRLRLAIRTLGSTLSRPYSLAPSAAPLVEAPSVGSDPPPGAIPGGRMAVSSVPSGSSRWRMGSRGTSCKCGRVLDVLAGTSLKREKGCRKSHRVGRSSHNRLELFPQVVYRIKALADLDNILNIPIELIDT